MAPSRLTFVEWTFQEQPGRIAVRLWGAHAPDRPAVVCVHGLSRNARDFDELAQALSARFRVACIDMPGRGDSTWLADPAGYTQDHYARIARHVIDALHLGAVHWVGTSMGGLLGLRMAASRPDRVRSLVLNDVGAELHGSELAQLRAAAGEDVTFADPREALGHFRERYAAFGITTEERWQSLTATSIEPAGERWRPRFDPRAVPQGQPPAQVLLWDQYLALRCPVLVLRGAESQLLDRATCMLMARTGPRTEWIEIPGAGHAPDLTGAARVGPIVDFIVAAEDARAAVPEPS